MALHVLPVFGRQFRVPLPVLLNRHFHDLGFGRELLQLTGGPTANVSRVLQDEFPDGIAIETLPGLDAVSVRLHPLQYRVEAREHVEIAGPDILFSLAVVVEQDGDLPLTLALPLEANPPLQPASDVSYVALKCLMREGPPARSVRLLHNLPGEHGGLTQARDLGRRDRPGHLHRLEPSGI